MGGKSRGGERRGGGESRGGERRGEGEGRERVLTSPGPEVELNLLLVEEVCFDVFLVEL